MQTNRPSRPALFVAALLCGAGAFAVLASGGCRQKNETERVAQTITAAGQVAPTVKAFVRLDDLIKASPLQADIARLQAAQVRLLRFDTAPGASRGATVMEGYALPTLSSGSAARPSASQIAASARQKDAQTRLLRSAERTLAGFEDEARQTRDRRAAQKESERIAEAEITGAETLRLARQAGERDTREQVADVALPLSINRARNGVFQAQLTPANPSQDTGLPPILDQATFEAEIAKLKADPEARGISTRARLELKRRTNQARIDALEREIRQIVAQGQASIRSEVARLRAERLAKIRQEIAQLKQDDDGLQIAENARQSLQGVLASESAAARRALVGTGLLPAGQGQSVMAESLVLGELAADSSKANGGDVVRARDGVARLRKQEQTLRALIVTDARESIRDNAQTRNVDVVVVEPGASPSAASTAGRRDMTQTFKRWFLSVGAGQPEAEPARTGLPTSSNQRMPARPSRTRVGEEKA